MWYATVLYVLVAVLQLSKLSFHHPDWVELSVRKGAEGVSITTNVLSAGKAQVWVPVGSVEYVFDYDVLVLRVKNSGVPIQLSVVFRKEGGRDYYMERIFIPVTEGPEEYRVKFRGNRKVFAPEVIERLKANTGAGLILHFQNAEDGLLRFNLSEVSIKEGD